MEKCQERGLPGQRMFQVLAIVEEHTAFDHRSDVCLGENGNSQLLPGPKPTEILLEGSKSKKVEEEKLKTSCSLVLTSSHQ